ncbi:hypothetical protein NCC49_006243 [Naganishia albida]|nr:hypothetical protein NCC49_006243 [Naganishia albida]
MTRVTSFLMPKRGQEASTFEEMQAGARKSNPQPIEQKETKEDARTHEEPRAKVLTANALHQAKRRENQKKRKRENAEKAGTGEKIDGADKVNAGKKDEGEQAPRANGWGKREDIKRKAQRTEQRRQGREHDRTSNTICFACRGKGHAAKDCPNVLLAGEKTELESINADAADTVEETRGLKRKKGKKGADLAGSSGRCYRCDSSEHPLSRCPKPPSVGLPFAHCFICLEKGHLASKCPSNSRGIYPNGGSCKVCGSVQHRAQDCPDDKRGAVPAAPTLTEAEEELLKMKDDVVVLGTGREAGADEDDFMTVKRKRTEVERKHADAKAQQLAAKKAQSAQQKRQMHKSQLMGAAVQAEGPSALELLAAGERDPSPVQVPVLRTAAAAPVRKKAKVVVF